MLKIIKLKRVKKKKNDKDIIKGEKKKKKTKEINCLYFFIFF